MKDSIEEAAERMSTRIMEILFKDEKKWQQERSYSEEDMIEFAYNYMEERRDKGARAMNPELLIKQFKKK